MKYFLRFCFVLSFSGVFMTGCKKEDTPVTVIATAPADPGAPPSSTAGPIPPVPTVLNDNDHMLMGNPSNADFNPTNFDNYLMRKTYYSVSYNASRGGPNWVSWHLFPGDLGSTPRQDDFREDSQLPAGYYRVQPTNYSGSGFDKGHNCPSGDRTITVPSNSATFLMTNMIPQAPNNNQLTWANMETYDRSLVSSGGKELYTIMGSYGAGGTGDLGYTTTISGGTVTVPAFIWKVVVVLDNGNNDLSRVTPTTRVIAVITPNTNAINSNWKIYRTSVDAIEAATGYDLLSALPVSVQAVLESQVDTL